MALSGKFDKILLCLCKNGVETILENFRDH